MIDNSQLSRTEKYRTSYSGFYYYVIGETFKDTSGQSKESSLFVANRIIRLNAHIMSGSKKNKKYIVCGESENDIKSRT
jgi:hypothetical protein